MKLVSKKKKTAMYVAIGIGAAILVALIGCGIAIAAALNNFGDAIQNDDKPMIIEGIAIATSPAKTVYYVGESSDFSGTKIYVLTNSNETTYTVGENELIFTGFDSSVANDSLPITVTYIEKTTNTEYTTTFNVVIKENPSAGPVLQSIRVSDDFQTTYDKTYWNKYGPDTTGKKLICTYSDGSEQVVSFKYSYCYDVDLNVQSAGTTQFIVKYTDGTTWVSTTITVTITE